MFELELLAPARNADIGIAAIGCGADAVYIAGPGFGARQAAGNSIDDIRRLCEYAHRFGARIFITLNTILYDSELEEAYRMMLDVQDAGADAFIVQDLAVLALADGGPDGKGRKVTIPMHASTQCAIRTPEAASFYESLGFSRLVLERQLSLDDIRRIRKSVSAELEFFVHGALCVCYSGQCYLSENISGRSANRGACIQACRSRYDLADASGKVLVRNKALLSLKDYNLLERIGELAGAGICSFKIEGRLKNISYVRNVVREYSMALDRLVAANPDRFRRSSFGKVEKGFVPDPAKTFNRGYTSLFIDGKRGAWASMDTPKSMGEEIGTVASVKPCGRDAMEIRITPATDGPLKLSNGDGFAFATSGSIVGFRGDVCSGNTISCRPVKEIRPGMKLFRNISVEFEKILDRQPCERLVGASVSLSLTMDSMTATATTEDGRSATARVKVNASPATDEARMVSMFIGQIGKKASDYRFTLVPSEISAPEGLPHVPASAINELRRALAEALDAIPCNRISMAPAVRSAVPDVKAVRSVMDGDTLSYKANVSNALSERMYRGSGAGNIEPAYELAHQKEAELMRSKYCIRHELGLCLKTPAGKGVKGPLYLMNNGRRLQLGFDCAVCEMTVSSAD